MFANTLNVFRTQGLGAAIYFHLSNKIEVKTRKSFILSASDSASLSAIRRRITGTQQQPVSQPIDYAALHLSLEALAFLDYLDRIQDLLVSRRKDIKTYVIKLEFHGELMSTGYYRLVTLKAGKDQEKLSQVEIHGLS